MSQLRNNNAERFDFLDGAIIGTRINPTDLDLVYERKGNFLVLEGKRPGQPVPLGQEILFTNLSRKPDFKVVLFEGNPPEEIHRFAWWGEDIHDGAHEGDAEGLRSLVREWYHQADTEVF